MRKRMVDSVDKKRKKTNTCDQVSHEGSNENQQSKKRRVRVSWQFRYDQLVEFRNEFGHTNVAQNYAKNMQLAAWVKFQRSQYKNSTLIQERINQLNEELSFVWDLSVSERWQTRYDQLVEFRNEFGHTNVAQNYAKNMQLAAWVKFQRSQYKNSTLIQERINQLNELEFEWSRKNKKKATDLKQAEKKKATDLKRAEKKKATDAERAEKKKATDLKRAEKKKATDLKRAEKKKATDLKRAERKRKAESTKKERPVLGCSWWNRSAIQTQVSMISQDAQAGRNTIINAIRSGFAGFEVLDEIYRDQLHFKDDAGTEFPFTCAQTICDADHADAIAFKNHLETTFNSMNGNETKLHTRKGRLFDLNNTNDDDEQHKKKEKKALHLNLRSKNNVIFQRYDESASKMDGGKKSKKINTDSVVHSASAFKGKRSKVDNPVVLKPKALKDMTSKQIMAFLGWHWDTHSLPTLFIAYSKGKSWIYYRDKEGKIVGRLQLEAGLSIIYTTKIHSGLEVCNRHGFKHCSASETDRVLIRFVHAAPEGGLNMDRTQAEWLELALFLLRTNFPVQTN